MLVLMAFATSRGSTQGIAERLAGRLRRHGIATEVRAVSDSVDIARYDAVVLGSAVHAGKWLTEGRTFALQNAAVLRQRPNWLFSVSTVGDQESMFPPGVSKKFRAMRKETAEIAALREAVHSREHRNFAGAISRSDWPAAGRAFFRAAGGRYGDHRNWPAIDAWADTIATQLAVPSPIRPERVPR
jgi:menaquinone-dependent protoporphyrinogen oxidase